MYTWFVDQSIDLFRRFNIKYENWAMISPAYDYTSILSKRNTPSVIRREPSGCYWELADRRHALEWIYVETFYTIVESKVSFLGA